MAGADPDKPSDLLPKVPRATPHRPPSDQKAANASSQSTETADSLAGIPVTIGEYHIVRELGRGGMAVVYEAEQQTPRRTSKQGRKAFWTQSRSE